MSQPKLKRSLGASMREQKRLFQYLHTGRLPYVSIIQDKVTGKILGVGVDHESAHKAMVSAGLDQPEWDVNQYMVVK